MHWFGFSTGSRRVSAGLGWSWPGGEPGAGAALRAGARGRAPRRPERWRGRVGPALVLLGALLGTPLLRAQAPPPASPPAPRGKTGKRWLDMEYGPFLTSSIEAPSPATNIAYKGIAIRLAEAFGGQHGEAVVFDTDLLRYSVGWTGHFLALKGVVFDGEHWAYPHIDGEEVFGNPNLPGWAKAGRFQDPRPFIYGPLPRDWAHWKGLFLDGQKVILAYSVGRADVLEMPGLETGDGLTAFARNFEVGQSDQDLTVQLAFEGAKEAHVARRDTLTSPPASADADQTVAWLAPRPTAPPGPATDLHLADGLWGHWDFGTNSDTLWDVSGHRHTLRLGSHTTAPGPAGPALVLTGQGYGVISGGAPLEFLQTDLTLCAWINTRQDGTLVAQAPAQGPWAPDGKALFVREGKLTFDVGWVGAVASARRVDDGRWQHVAMTWSHRDGVITLYVNGTADGTRELRPKQPTPLQVWRVGYASPDFPPTSLWRGQIADARLYTRRLSQAELAALAGPAHDTGLLAVGGVGLPAGCAWEVTEPGHLRLRIPARATPARFRVLLAGLPAEGLPRFAHLLARAAPAPALAPHTHGGPPRWHQTLATRGQLGSTNGPYAIDKITWPAENPWDSWMRFGGFDFFKDHTRAAISTWSGDVWIVSGIDATLQHLRWRRFATGLYQPLGLKIVGDQIYVAARDQITRLHDLNGDGEADWYENFNNDTMNTEHFHEFVLDLQTDAAGNFYYMKCGRHAREALHPQHGTLMKVSPDGRQSTIVAKGFRAPNGLEISPDGRFFTTDQEGYWMPANRLDLVKPGGFYGNGWSWFPRGRPTAYDPPICWIHPRVDRSPSTMVWVTSTQWGPLKDDLLSLSYGVGRIFRVMHEEVEGVTQGGITPLPVEFDTGIMRARFGPDDGQLYVCGLYGWAGNKTEPGGFFRVRYTGQPLRLPASLHVATNGVVVGFSVPLDPISATDPGNYSVEVWNYRWTANYGSPDFKRNGEPGRDRLTVTAAQLGRDGRSVFLEMPGLTPVMQMNIQMNLKAADGTPFPTYVHNTIHRLGHRSGADLLGAPWVVAAARHQPRLAHPAPGLLETFTATATVGPATDARRARLVALRVAAGQPPTPFLPGGPFTAQWSGFLKLDLNGVYQFHAVGRGAVAVRVNGQVATTVMEDGESYVAKVLAAHFQQARSAGLTPPAEPARPRLPLEAGLNRLEVTYESPPAGEASFRLYWSAAGVPLELVPPTALVHDADAPALATGATRRLGRDLFATRHCAACHAPAAPFGPDAMPELAADAPALDSCGRRLNQAWVADWIVQPTRYLEGAGMPRCLSGTPAEVATRARDLAAYLATQTAGGGGAPPINTDGSTNKLAGESLYAKLGCAACHHLPGDQPLPQDQRLSLAYLNLKWRSGALAEYLAAPQQTFHWTRMPDFHLTRAEASALAAYLRARAEPASRAASTAAGGDAARGRQSFVTLGCVSCHTLPGVPQTAPAPSVDRLAGKQWTTGCLAPTPAQRGRAPDFGFEPEARQALERFLAHDLDSLRRRVWPEFAARQFGNLRCAACHQRDGVSDVWSALEARQPATPAPAANPYDAEDSPTQTIHRLRPPLTWTGEKLRPEWVEQFLLGTLPYKPRPKLEARMPAFPAYAAGLARGLALEHGLPPVSPARPPVNFELAKAGQALIQKGALGCVDCHAVGTQPALAGADTSTINFAHVPDRLRATYFDRYVLDPQRLLPGTMMPRFVNDAGFTGVTAFYQGDGRQQFDAIWNYLRTLRND